MKCPTCNNTIYTTRYGAANSTIKNRMYCPKCDKVWTVKLSFSEGGGLE